MKIDLALVPIYLTAILNSTIPHTNSDKNSPSFKLIPLNGAFGPESLAFDPKGDGLCTGVRDGRVLKLRKNDINWIVSDFAVTSPHSENCIPYSVEREEKCGRPLGLRFDEKKGELYVADAYFGLLVVGAKGGLATQLVSEVEGQKLVFTNDLEIDHRHRVIYFTDASTVYQRRQFMQIMQTGDKTGRLIKYDISTKKSKVLLRNLTFANGVAISKDSTFLLVAETTLARILKYYLVGPKSGKVDVFAELPGFPDNIRRNSKGEFWVATNTNTSQAIAVKLSEEGKVLRVYEDKKKVWSPISQVDEKDGKLWMGSVQRFNVSVHDLD